MLYPEARTLLIEQGIRPVSAPPDYGQRSFLCGADGDLECQKYPEWFDMSSGPGFSSFLYERPDGRRMIVVAQGEPLDRAVVSDWRDE